MLHSLSFKLAGFSQSVECWWRILTVYRITEAWYPSAAAMISFNWFQISANCRLIRVGVAATESRYSNFQGDRGAGAALYSRKSSSSSTISNKQLSERSTNLEDSQHVRAYPVAATIISQETFRSLNKTHAIHERRRTRMPYQYTTSQIPGAPHP